MAATAMHARVPPSLGAVTSTRSAFSPSPSVPSSSGLSSEMRDPPSSSPTKPDRPTPTAAGRRSLLFKSCNSSSSSSSPSMGLFEALVDSSLSSSAGSASSASRSRRRSRAKENGETDYFTSRPVESSLLSSSTPDSPSSSSPCKRRRVMFASKPLPSLDASPTRSSKAARANATTSASASASLSFAAAIRAPGLYHTGSSSSSSSLDSSKRQQCRRRVYSDQSPPSILAAAHHDDEVPDTDAPSPSLRFLQYHHHPRRHQHQHLIGPKSGNGLRSSPLNAPSFLLPSPPPSQPRVGAPGLGSTSTTAADQDEEDDEEDNDEDEEEAIEQLLLSNSPAKLPFAAASPCPSFLGLPTPPPSSDSDQQPSSSSRTPDGSHIKGILKPFDQRTAGVGESTRCAEEGKRKNGRRHHPLRFDLDAAKNDEALLIPPVLWSTYSDTVGGERHRGSTGTREQQGSGSASNKGKGSATSTSRRAGHTSAKTNGQDDGDDEDEQRRRPAAATTGKDSTAKPAAKELDPEDPCWLLGPLQALRGSLREIAHPFIRPVVPEPDDEPLEADHPSPWAIPLELYNVEDAYVRLTWALTRLHPETIVDRAKTLSPLVDFRVTLKTCLVRDLANIPSFPAWVEETRRQAKLDEELRSRQAGHQDDAMRVDSSDSIVSSSPTRKAPPPKPTTGPKKSSYSEQEMTRLRDEVGVAQAAIKCFSSIVRSEVFSSLIKPADIDAILATMLSVPYQHGLAPLVCKDVFPFISFFLRMQQLPSATIDRHFPSIIRTLSMTLNQNDKNRVNLGESLSTLSTLFETHPRALLESVDDWFILAARGLWDTAKRGATVRNRALTVLTKLAREFVKHDQDEDAAWAEHKSALRRRVAVQMLSLMTEIRTQGHARITGLAVLIGQINASLPAAPAAQGSQARIDETPYLWLIHFLGVLPILMGPSFHKIEQKGIRPYCDLFRHLEVAPAPAYLRPLSAVAWSHVAHAFAIIPGTNDPDDLWVMRPDGKPINVLLSMLNHRNQLSWTFPTSPSPAPGPNLAPASTTSDTAAVGEDAQTTSTVAGATPAVPGPASPSRRTSHKLHTEALARLVTSLIGGLGEAVLGSCGGSTSARAQRQFNQLFEMVAPKHLVLVLTSSFEEVQRVGWDTLAAIARPSTKGEGMVPKVVQEQCLDQSMVLDVFMNPSILELGKDPRRTFELTRRAIDSTGDPSKIKGWGSMWTTERIDFILEIVLSGAQMWDAAELRLDPARGFELAVFEMGILPVWLNILACFEERPDPDDALLKVVHWLHMLLTSEHVPTEGMSASSLALRLLPSFVHSMSDRLLSLPVTEDGQNALGHLIATLVASKPLSARVDAEAFDVALRAVLKASLGATPTSLNLILDNAPDEEFLSLCSFALTEVAPMLSSTAASLVRFTPLLLQVQRVLDIMENDSQHQFAEQSVRIIVAARNLWKSMFVTLELSPEIETIVALLMHFEDIATQATASASQVVGTMIEDDDAKASSANARELDAAGSSESDAIVTSAPTVPAPAQPLRTLESEPPTPSEPASRPMAALPTSAYQGDASAPIPEDGSLESSLEEELPALDRPLAPISSSLGLERVGEGIPASLRQPSPESSVSVLEETPLELEQKRIQSSLLGASAAIAQADVVADEESMETQTKVKEEVIPSSANDASLQEPPRQVSMPAFVPPFGRIARPRVSDSIIIEDSDSSDDGMLITALVAKRSSQASSSAGSRKGDGRPASVAGKVPRSTPIVPSISSEPARSEVVAPSPARSLKRRRSSSTFSLEIESYQPPRRKLAKSARSEGKQREVSNPQADGEVISSSPIASPSKYPVARDEVETSSAVGSPTSSPSRGLKDSLRSILAGPVDQIVRTAWDVGGVTGLNTLIEIGEQARAYLERKKRRRGATSSARG